VIVKQPVLLICDDDPLIHMAVKQALKPHYECRSAHDVDEALVIIKNNSIDILLLDIQIRTDDEGIKALPKFRGIDPDLPIVMMSGLTDFRVVREAMRLGASDYVAKDLEQNDLSLVLSRALEKKNLIKRNAQQSSEVSLTQKKHVMIGAHPKIKALQKTIERIRMSPANVLIYGETGTGKEVVARHLRKTLPDGSLAPFVAIDSATIQSSTAESLLFGHEKGAFTGAEKMTKGAFEEADGGVIYFDEIANMPLEIQSKLLRVLQEKEVTRMGSSRTLQLDFRVICATNKNLEQMVKAGEFKDDLLQRLNVIPLEIPPLRERLEDLPLLVEYLIAKNAGRNQSLHFTSSAITCLQLYSWPGNVRELGNLVSYLIAMTEGIEVDISDLPPKFRDFASQANANPNAKPVTTGTGFYDRVALFEKELLIAEYAAHGGNVGRMALAIGMDRSHLYQKLKEHRIHAARPG